MQCASDSNVNRCNEVTRSTKEHLNDDLSSLIPALVDNNSDILNQTSDYFQHLSPDQSSQLQELLNEYRDVCKNLPAICSTAKHAIELTPVTTPIRQHFYRISQEKLKLMKDEVAYLLSNGLATPNSSPWASPLISVPKPNGQVRLCTDYHKLNNITIKQLSINKN